MTITTKKLIYVGFAFQHHKNTQAGYHHIKDYLVYDKIIDAQWEVELLDGSTILKKILRKLYFFAFGTGLSITVIRCILLALLNKNQIFHFIYAENTYKWLHLFVGKTNKIVLTLHQPKSYFDNNLYWKKILPKIDKIILMSDKDITFFKEITGKDNIYFIPHGINANFYKSDLTLNKSIDILLVGNWLRDFDFANELFNRLIDINKNIKICIVTNHENFKYFSNKKNIELLSKISDDKLKLLYQTSKCMFLPLIEYTANNAILEAAATGCKIIVATNNVDYSYLNDETIDFLDLNTNTVFNYFSKLDSLIPTNNKANETVEYVKTNFSWEKIALQTLKTLSI